MITAATGTGLLETIRCCAKSPWEAADPRTCLREVRAAMDRPLAVLKNDGMKRTLRTHLAPWGEVCLQDFQWNAKRKAISPFRWSRGRRIWHYAGEIAKGGVPVLEPLLFLEIKRLFFVARTVIVTPWLEKKIDLGKIALSEEWRGLYHFDHLLDQAVDLVARLHGLGFLHGDLKWSNFVYAIGDPEGLILTDLDGVKRSSSNMLRGKDYARFVLSAPAYGADWLASEPLIRRYLNSLEGSSRLLRWSLHYHVKRKMGRYRGKNPYQ